MARDSFGALTGRAPVADLYGQRCEVAGAQQRCLDARIDRHVELLRAYGSSHPPPVSGRAFEVQDVRIEISASAVWRFMQVGDLSGLVKSLRAAFR